MPNIKSAKKRVRQTNKKHLRNIARKSAIKTAIKDMKSALESKDVAQAKELLKDINAKLSRAKSKGILHANTAARKMSRLAKKVSAAEQAK
jgi:small subunit ribosomal protein S20